MPTSTTVVQRGTDTSGRALKLSQAMWDVLDDLADELDFEFTIVKGGYLPGDDLSSTTHMGDAVDIRLRDKTPTERALIIKGMNARGIAYWERYPSQGFDLHGHGVPGRWASPSPSALAQFDDLVNGKNGLKGHGPDYHDRSNFVKTPPNKEKPEMNAAETKLLADTAAAVKGVAADLKEVKSGLKALRSAESQRFAIVRQRDLTAIRSQLESAKDVSAALAVVTRLEAEAKAEEA